MSCGLSNMNLLYEENVKIIQLYKVFASIQGVQIKDNYMDLYLSTNGF